MSDFLAQLSAAPSRGHGAANTTDNDYDRQLRDLLAYLKQPSLVPSTADLNEVLEVRIHPMKKLPDMNSGRTTN
jgi:COP9 signalosome complex subunit 3